MQASTQNPCLNCGQNMTGAFCQNCGQKRAGRLKLREIVNQATAQLFHMDAAVPRTLWGLSRYPGKLCRDYIGGKRIRYVPPFRYCVVSVTLLFLWYALIGMNLTKALEVGASEETTQQIQKIIAVFISKHFNLIIFLAIPFLTLVLKRLFKSKYNFAEIYVLALYTMGHIFLFSLLLSPIRYYWSDIYTPIRILIQTLYLAWACAVFFETKPLTALIKSIIANILYFTTVAILIFILALPQILPVLRG